MPVFSNPNAEALVQAIAGASRASSLTAALSSTTDTASGPVPDTPGSAASGAGVRVGLSDAGTLTILPGAKGGHDRLPCTPGDCFVIANDIASHQAEMERLADAYDECIRAHMSDGDFSSCNHLMRQYGDELTATVEAMNQYADCPDILAGQVPERCLPGLVG